MKKITKAVCFTAAVLTSSLLFSCNQGGFEPSSSPISLNSLEFDFDDAETFAVTFGAQTNSRAASGKKNKLIKFDAKGNGKNVIKIKTNDFTEDDLSPCMEIKKNPYKSIPGKAKGQYIVFKERNWLNNGNIIGQLLYVYPNGDVVDLTKEMILSTTNSEWHGLDFIEFANDGRAFFIVQDWDEVTELQNDKIFSFDPVSKEIKEINLGLGNNYELGDFRINDDGKWMFVSALINARKRDDGPIGETVIYAVPTDNPSGKISLYQHAKEELGWEAQYVESGKITFDKNTKMMYVSTGISNGMFLGNSKRFYKFENGKYSAENVVFYEDLYLYVIPNWYRYYTQEANCTPEEAYEKMAINIKNYCDMAHNDYNPAAGSSDDIIITLDCFNNEEYKELYDADATDGKAVQIFLENLYPNGYADAYGEDYRKINYQSKAWSFIWNYCTDEGGGLFPVEQMCWLKDENGKASNTKAFKQDHAMYPILCMEELVSVKDGTYAYRWVQKYDDNGNKLYDTADIIKVTDAAGNFVCEVPEALKGLEGIHTWEKRQPDDPWYKTPFSVSDSGIALVKRDQKNIYFYDGTTLTENLISDTSNIDKIVNVTVDGDTVIYTAKSTSGDWITEEINISTKDTLKFNTNARIGSVIKSEIESE